jgi:hypothetical protein
MASDVTTTKVGRSGDTVEVVHDRERCLQPKSERGALALFSLAVRRLHSRPDNLRCALSALSSIRELRRPPGVLPRSASFAKTRTPPESEFHCGRVRVLQLDPDLAMKIGAAFPFPLSRSRRSRSSGASPSSLLIGNHFFEFKCFQNVFRRTFPTGEGTIQACPVHACSPGPFGLAASTLNFVSKETDYIFNRKQWPFLGAHDDDGSKSGRIGRQIAR